MVDLNKNNLKVSLKKKSPEAAARVAQERRVIVRRGSFHHAFRYEKLYLAVWAVVNIACTIILFVGAYNYGLFSDSERTLTISEFIIISIGFFAATEYAVIITGTRCEYRAEETEFVVKGPHKNQEIFYYSDVQEVSFEPIRSFIGSKGYLITVTTGVRDIKYRYIFGDSRRNNRPEDSPFYYLEYNSGLCEKDTTPPPDVDVVMEMIAVEKYQRSFEDIREKDDSFFS